MPTHPSDPRGARLAPREDASPRSRLLRSGLRLFALQGFAKTSTRELAEDAGVNIASISYYFGDKAGLYRAAFSEPLGAPRDGAARFDRFVQVAEAGLDEKFEYFGEVDRTLQFEAMEDEASGEAQLFVRDERVLPSKDDPLRQDITASERIVTELPAEYYPYWNFLPEYVTRFSRSN